MAGNRSWREPGPEPVARSWQSLGPVSTVLGTAGPVVLAAVGDRAGAYTDLHPAERAEMAARPAARRADFALGRRSARLCLDHLGVTGPVLTGPRGRPVFPTPVAGSVSHSGGVGVCAAVPDPDTAIGVDLQVLGRLGPEHAGHLCAPGERDWAYDGDSDRWTELFSAKEAVYKALGSLTPHPPTYPGITLRPRPGGFTAVPPSGPDLTVHIRRLDRFVLAWARCSPLSSERQVSR